MAYLINETTPVARKDYRCEASCFVTEDQRDYDDSYTNEEKWAVDEARKNEFMIKKGERYINQFINDGGIGRTFRAIPEMHDICIEYGFYED